MGLLNLVHDQQGPLHSPLALWIWPNRTYWGSRKPEKPVDDRRRCALPSSTRVFETRMATGREHFACQDRLVSQFFILLISSGEKILSNVNVVVCGKNSLPVAVHVSKNAKLKTGGGRWGGNVSELFAQDVTIYVCSHTGKFKQAVIGERILCQQQIKRHKAAKTAGFKWIRPQAKDLKDPFKRKMNFNLMRNQAFSKGRSWV